MGNILKLNGTISTWQIDELVSLVRCRYPDWSDFSHPPFVADELDYKHKAVVLADELLGQQVVESLMSKWQYDELLQRALRLGRETNLLWLRVPKSSDLNILLKRDVDKAELSQQLVRLWHGKSHLSERVQQFAAYALERQLPLKWPFITYFPFLLHPEEAIFVKPTIMQWFLKFMGQRDHYSRSPTGLTYRHILNLAAELKEALSPFGAEDMIDVQSFLWVAAREAKGQTGRLTPQAQIELNVPYDEEPVLYDEEAPERIMAEAPTEYRSARELISKEALETRLCLPEVTIDGWLTAITRKKQAIFQGPPGTGKTFAAQLVAEHLLGEGDGFSELIQFHPNYAYEEFIQGIRPVGDSFATVEGHFLRFCQEAAERTGACVLIIDEMNRAPLSRVFGELMYLLEYREKTIQLAGGGEFSIPENVFILGTMNSADRSIALVDFALRRRFAFLQLVPNYELLRRFHEGNPGEVDIEALVSQIQGLNQLIDDPAYSLGVSFFLLNELAAQLQSIWITEIEPYLNEYFFDRPERIEPFRWIAVKKKLIPQS